MRFRAVLVLIALAPGGLGRLDGAPRIVAGELVCVSCDRPGVAHVEPVLAADPADPNLLFGAAVTLPHADRRRGGIEASAVAGFRSLDGGRSWTRITFSQCLVDPWVSFGKERDVYLSCLARGGAIAVFRSPDGGRTWRRPVRLPAGGGGSADHPILAVDRSQGPRGGTVYVAFAQLLPAAAPRRQPRFGTAMASSRDGGRTFSAPVFLRHDGLNQQPFDAAVLTDGSLVLLFMDYASRERPLARRQAWAARSADGGRSFSISAVPFAPPDRLMPLPLAADRSGAHRDRLYLAAAAAVAVAGDRPPDAGPPAAGTAPAPGRGGRCQQGAPGTPGVPGTLSVLSSDDGGESWGSAVAVAGGALAASRETPAIAVNTAGVVGLAWYDTRRDPRGECFDIYFSASLDGGRTFPAEVRVTHEMSCPAAGKDRAVASRWPFGGDYSGLATAADGSFRIFWAGGSSGVYQLWTATAAVAPAQ